MAVEGSLYNIDIIVGWDYQPPRASCETAARDFDPRRS